MSNQRKAQFLERTARSSFEDDGNVHTQLSKFSFAYFDNSQRAGQDFNDWTHDQLSKLLTKLKEYSKKPLNEWQLTKIGSGKHRYNVLEIYERFPTRSDFTPPKHVPHQAEWARFRLEGDMRLIGFVIPNDYSNQINKKTGYLYCRNTFYVVFLDGNHKFYITK